MVHLTNKDYLDIADLYAQKASGCRKVAVGCAIVKDDQIISLGANQSILSDCKSAGCYRYSLYGDDSKVHRNPEDCSAVHSEIDAIAHLRESPKGTTVYVTRYPCEGCAKALIAAGVSHIVYGGSTKVNLFTKMLFDEFDIRLTYIPDWKEDNTDR